MHHTFGAESHWADIDGPVHYVDFGGSDEGPPIVCVHGLGGSYMSWLAVGSKLAEQGRVLALDLSGFGKTPPGERGSTVTANRRLLRDFVAQVVGEPVVLVGNSMGGTISIMHAAAEPEDVAGLVLVGPAVPRAFLAPIDLAVVRDFASHVVPVLGGVRMRRRLERLGPEGLTQEMLELVCADADRVPDELVALANELRRERTEMPWADQSLLDASRSLMATLLQRRTFDSYIATISAPTLIVQGEADRLVPHANATRISEMRPDWEYELLDDVGHVPQLEVPELFVDIVGPWLARLPASAGASG